jgi:hypothetical protein
LFSYRETAFLQKNDQKMTVNLRKFEVFLMFFTDCSAILYAASGNTDFSPGAAFDTGRADGHKKVTKQSDICHYRKNNHQ